MTVSGGIKVKGVRFQIGSHLAGILATIVRDDTTIAFYDVGTGELLIEHPRPQPGITCVGNGQSRGPRKNQPNWIVTETLTHHRTGKPIGTEPTPIHLSESVAFRRAVIRTTGDGLQGLVLRLDGIELGQRGDD